MKSQETQFSSSSMLTNAQTQTSVISVMQNSVERYLSEQVKYLQERVLIYQDLVDDNNVNLHTLLRESNAQSRKPLGLSRTRSQ